MEDSKVDKSLTLQAMKRDKKQREFREYLADKGIVLAMVKFLLALKQSDNPPNSPAEYIQQYFGVYKDPMWDIVDNMKADIEGMKTSIENKLNEIQNLKNEITKAKRSKLVRETFAALGPDAQGILSTKVLVQKLSGQPRFDTDLKLNQMNFVNFIMEHLISGANEDEKERFWTMCFLPFREIGTLGEDGKPKPAPFVGRLDDPSYVRILEKIRSYVLK
ncbi:unnamed protein product [Blepharisma stoltei]|uniref:Uncharacterized protein n=1 Tax=Blepharisma stoltei TaxID=1481888 RepID=A0AAU9ITD9_9CILI|nr:unnamed protein product [Blepharisma stoltei]